MLPAKLNFLHHVRWLRAAADAVGAQVLMEFGATEALVRQAGRHWVLHPQFMTEVQGVIRYVRRMPDAPAVFAGWRPSVAASWPASLDKLVFKRAATRLGLRVPAFSLADDGDGLADVIVKRASGSFGEHVHGPFRIAAERSLKVADGEFYERFIRGSMLKVWYCNDRAVALERDLITSVTGDGESTVRQLVERRLDAQVLSVATARETLMERVAQLLAFEGRRFDDVMPIGVTQSIEFRYGSDLGQARNRMTVDLSSSAPPEWQALVDAGPAFASLIPQEFRGCLVYTIDAVLDEDGQLWFLEMNANPVVHPLAYASMLQILTKAPDPAGTA